MVIVEPKCVEDHGEEDELPKEGDNERGGRDDLGQEEEEHRQGEQDRDGQGHLVVIEKMIMIMKVMVMVIMMTRRMMTMVTFSPLSEGR